MKNMKKNFNLVLALVLSIMMIAGMIPAMADGEYSIAINNTNPNVSIIGNTYYAYKLFDVAYKAETSNDSVTSSTDPSAYDTVTEGYAYTLNTSTNKFWAIPAVQTILNDVFTFTATNDANVKSVSVTDGELTTAEAIELTQALYPYLKEVNDASVTTATITADGHTAQLTGQSGTIENITGPGYYLVAGKSANSSTQDTSVTDITALVSLTTTHPKALVNPKVDAPTIDKKIDEGTGDGAVEGAIDDKDKSEDTHAVGDSIPYVIESKVPKMTGYNNYWFVATDHLTGGLSYNNDLVVKLGGKTLTAGTHYVVTYCGTADGTYAATLPEDYAEGKDLYIKITFKSFINWAGTASATADQATFFSALDGVTVAAGGAVSTYEGSKIDITYTATLNNSAVIGNEGNPNTVKLQYSTNPNEDYDGDTPTGDKPTGTTPEKEVKTYTTGFELLKWGDKTGTPDWEGLAGATFTLEGSGLNKITQIAEDTYTKDDNGLFYKLKDGTYTKTIPTDETKQYYYNDGQDKYSPASTVKYTKEGLDSSDNIKYTVTTGSDGKLSFTGLPEGTYTLTETEAPEGYNKLEKPIIIKVTAKNLDDNTDNDVAWEGRKYNQGESAPENANIFVTGSDKMPNNAGTLFDVEVKNDTGALLPSTGGMGTTLFYIGGGILVVLAIVMLVTKRRMSSND